MAFNSENDPDLVIDPDFWGKGFRSRRNDPSIHTSQPEVLSFFRTFDDSNSLADGWGSDPFQKMFWGLTLFQKTNKLSRLSVSPCLHTLRV
jgi:hypothetical protein